MQKVVGSSPIIRSKKAPLDGVFVAQQTTLHMLERAIVSLHAATRPIGRRVRAVALCVRAQSRPVRRTRCREPAVPVLVGSRLAGRARGAAPRGPPVRGPARSSCLVRKEEEPGAGGPGCDRVAENDVAVAEVDIGQGAHADNRDQGPAALQPEVLTERRERQEFSTARTPLAPRRREHRDPAECTPLLHGVMSVTRENLRG
jgi:hypothetical protein